MKWYFKILIALSIVILIAILSLDYLVTRFVDKEIKKIQLELKDTYNFQYDDIDVEILERQVILEKFTFNTLGDQRKLKNKFDFSLDKLFLKVDNYKEAIKDGKLHITVADLNGPTIMYGLRREMSKANVDEHSFDDEPEQRDSLTLDTSSSAFINTILFDKLRIVNGKADVYHLDNPEKKLIHINKVTISSDEFNVNLNETKVEKIISGKNLFIELKQLKTDELKNHDLSIGKVDYFYSKDEVVITDLKFKNIDEPPVFVSKQKYRAPWMDIKVDSISMNLNFWRMYNKGVLYIKEIDIIGADATLYNDVTLELKPIHQDMPPRAIRDISVPLKIEKVALSKSQLKYNHKTKAENTGLFKLSEIEAKVSNVTNIDYIIDSDSNLLMDVSAKLWDSGDLTAKINIDLKNQLDYVFIKGRVLNMPLVKAENMIKPLYGVTVSSGQLINLSYDLTMNENIGKGNLRFDYSDLKVDIKKDSISKHIDESGKLKSNKFLNFVANEAIKKNNVPGGLKYKSNGNMIFDRTKNKPIFDLYWHSIQSGIMDIVVSDALYKSKSNYNKKKSKELKEATKKKKKKK